MTWGPTPKNHGKHLCDGCDNVIRIEDDRGERRYWCDCFHPVMPIKRPVVACTYFREKNQIHRDTLERIAWRLSTDKRGVAGFRPPSKRHGED